MELKHCFCNHFVSPFSCLNCTVMELKLLVDYLRVVFAFRLNCTVMELKLIYSYRLILRSGS